MGEGARRIRKAERRPLYTATLMPPWHRRNRATPTSWRGWRRKKESAASWSSRCEGDASGQRSKPRMKDVDNPNTRAFFQISRSTLMHNLTRKKMPAKTEFSLSLPANACQPAGTVPGSMAQPEAKATYGHPSRPYTSRFTSEDFPSKSQFIWTKATRGAKATHASAFLLASSPARRDTWRAAKPS